MRDCSRFLQIGSHNYNNLKGEITFVNNIAESGDEIFIDDYSTVTFDQNSNTKFINNSVNHNGAAIFLNSHSNVVFEQGSAVKFHY